MKRLCLLLLLLVSSSGAAQVAKTNLTLKWDYPTNELGTNIEFRIWTHTNVAAPFIGLSNGNYVIMWPMVASFPAITNEFKLTIQPGVHFYLLTARWTQPMTNETTGEVVYLESDPSNAALVYGPRRGTNLTIRP